MIKNLSKKLLNGTIIGFIFAVIVAVLSGINTIMYVKDFSNDMSWMRDNEIAGRNYILKSKIYLRDLDVEIKNLIISEDEIMKNNSVSGVKKAETGLINNLKRARPLFYSKTGKQLIDKSLASAGSLSRESDLIISLAANKEKKEAVKTVFGNFRSETLALDELLSKLENIKAANDSAIYKKLISSQKITILIVIIVLALTVLFRIVLVVYDHKTSRRKKIQKDQHDS